MKREQKGEIINFLKPLSVWVGTIVGAGIFALPFVAQKAGFFIVVFYFIFLFFISKTIHLFFSEVVAGTSEKHRFPGYVGLYLGPGWEKAAFLATCLSLFGSLLAYLILGGQFLKAIFSSFFGDGDIAYTILFLFVGAYFVFRGIRSIAETEIILLFLFLLVIVSFFIKAIPFFDFTWLASANFNYFFLPFGVVLFSLWGVDIIPEIKEMISVSSNENLFKKMKKLNLASLAISSLIYLFFIFIVFVSSAPFISQDAIGGMARIFGSESLIIKLGYILGFICFFTSYLTIALTLKKIFWYDFKVPKNFAWALTCFLPIIFLFLGAKNFIEVVSLTGAVAIGAEAIIIIFLRNKFLEKSGKKPSKNSYFLVFIFLLGAISSFLFYF